MVGFKEFSSNLNDEDTQGFEFYENRTTTMTITGKIQKPKLLSCFYILETVYRTKDLERPKKIQRKKKNKLRVSEQIVVDTNKMVLNVGS